MIKDLIKRMFMIEQKIAREIKEKEPTKKLEDIKEGIDILSMNTSKDPTDTDSSLELLLNLMCKAFKMKPKQAAALLTNSNQYLLHTVVKGLKSNYDPVMKFYRSLIKYQFHLCNILILESKKNNNNSTMLMIFNALKTGFFSYKDEVIVECLKLFKSIAELTIESDMSSAVYQWFITTSQEGGISAIMYVLKKHHDLIHSVAHTLIGFTKGNLTSLLKEIIKPLYPAPMDYFSIISDFTHAFVENEATKKELLSSGLVDYWLETNIKMADNDGKNTAEERTTSLAFVCDLWVLFPERLEEREDMSGQILNILKKV